MYRCGELYRTRIQTGFRSFATRSCAMYSLRFYGQMLADAPRMTAYAEALRQTVKRESVVLDLGSGPGLVALFACKRGGRRVYAVEPDNVVNLAREAAAAN